jgi:mannose-6-phosphate isomerase-like protein (cupin superfamily)
MAAAKALAAQVPAPVPPVQQPGQLAASRVFAFDAMPVRKTASGESRDIEHGVLATGDTVNLHQSMQAAGAVPVALHAIQHSEFICVREGELTFEREVEGTVVSDAVGAGGVIYVAFGTKHRVVNKGPVPARYFVVAIGGDAK